MTHYTARDRATLGQRFVDHMEAMTSEELDSKSNIAEELAWRDLQIEEALGEVARLNAAETEWHSNLQDHGAALDMIREAVETLGPVGAMPAVEAVAGPEPMDEAEAIVAGVMKIAAERDALKADLAKARGLRLGRGPTVEEIATLADRASDGLAWFLLEFDGGGYWEPCSTHVDDGRIIIDEVDDDGERLARVTDAIPLDDDRQPCPVGGWGIAQ